jgi:hypothetical protein
MHIPPYCPNPDCEFHSYEAAAHTQFWALCGSYTTKVRGSVQRFRCIHCGKGFSERTTSIDYFTKKNLNYGEILRATTAGESLTSIARNLGCSIGSVQNRQDRLGRNCIAMHARLLHGHKLIEDLCADGFESFDRSQYFPNAIHILTGTDSQFLYGNTHATLRRKGRMTVAQRKKRDAYDKAQSLPPGAIRRSFASLVTCIGPLWNKVSRPRLVLRTDEHPAYPQAIRHVLPLRDALKEGTFIHKRYSSKEPRTTANPLFPVNYYDRELRKDIAAFRRESTCFTRNVSNGLLRFVHHQIWHNYCKPYRVVSTAWQPETHAERAGIELSNIRRELSRLFTDRAFLSHQEVNEEDRKTWIKGHPTPLKEKRDYCQAFARVGLLQDS